MHRAPADTYGASTTVIDTDMEDSNVWDDSAPLGNALDSGNAAKSQHGDVRDEGDYDNAGTAASGYHDPYDNYNGDDIHVSQAWNSSPLYSSGPSSGEHENEHEHEHGYGTALQQDGDDVDEFKIQNELAHTMKSIFLEDEKTANGVEEEVNRNNLYSHYNHQNQDHVHYTDDVHRKSDAGNPFLVSSVNADDHPGMDHVDISILKEKKNQLLDSLTKESQSHGFLKDQSEIGNNVSADELFAGSPQKSLKGDADDSALDNLFMSAKEVDTSNNGSNRSETLSLNKRGAFSPNRKVKVLRPRRITKNLLHISEPSTATISETLAGPVDPLSAPLIVAEDHNDIGKIASPMTRKQKFINESEAPLFNVNKDKVLQANVRSLSSVAPSGASSDNGSIASYKPDDENIENFEITVGDPLKVGELTSAHVVYAITTTSKSELFNHETTVVTRRYNDFLWLYHQLLNNHPGYIIPPPPEKQAYGRFDDKFIENRRLALEHMLRRISKRKVLQSDPDFIMFLQSENFAEESKEREAVIYNEGDSSSRPSGMTEGLIEGPMHTMAQILNATVSLGITESSSGGGFFSSLIGLNVSKYVEEDTFIMQKQAYIDSLNEQLRQLTQSLDMILEKREELALSLNDVTAVIQQLADLEVNTEITDILNNFEELQTKIKELLERGNLSQVLTFGSTVDEYIRLIGSIGNCFDNRLKICNSVMTLKQHQEKKEHNLAKLRAKNQSQTEKLRVLEEELARINNVLDKQTKSKANFDKIFKNELSKFEFDKIKDFKNMVEIYWESLIENQKILIELWESFYEKCNFDS
jgi:sorting nexin-1/2